MTTPHRLILAAALLLLAAMGAFPPWVTGPVAHPSATTPVGYHPIFAPPSMAPPGPLVWSDKHQRLVRDGKPATTEAALDNWKPWEKYGGDANAAARALAMAGATRSVRIDYARLLVQWLVVAALAGVGILGARPRS